MTPSYTIDVDAGRGFLSLAFSGIWSEATFEDFDRDLTAERQLMQGAGLSADWPRVLIDTTRFGVQTQAVATRFVGRIERFHANRRLAFVGVPGQLSKLQLRRIASIEQHRFFDDHDAAIAWLFS